LGVHHHLPLIGNLPVPWRGDSFIQYNYCVGGGKNMPIV
jgi:hypothetical protein